MLVPLGIWTLPARSGWDDLDSGLITRRSARSPVTNRAAGVLLCSLTAPCGPFPPKSSGRTGRVYVYPPNVGLYTGVGTGSAPGNVGWNTGVTTLTQCGAEPMVAVCTHVHVGTVLTGQT